MLLSVLLTTVTLGLLLMTAYLVVLALAALVARARRPLRESGRRRFAILIPAHNEAVLIGRVLENVRGLDYQSALADVYVVADNCSDQTAVLARARGARVYERYNRTEQGKGFALHWLLEQVQAEGRDHDAYVVLDADSVVAPNFLRCMDARLEAGSQVVQAYYSVLNAQESPVAALRSVALAALHYLRPLGRAAFGLSCGLKGTGMCFAAPVLEQFTWRWYTLAEDVEFHLALVQEGIRVDFAPETSVLAEMPTTFDQASSQNARWERGRLQLLRHRVPGLFRSALAERSPLRLDAAVEQFIPPLSVPFALGGCCLLVSLALGAALPATLAALSLIGQVAYLLAGLVLVRAPLRIYLALGYAPLYVVWKLSIYARALLSTRTAHWVRTARTGEVRPRRLRLRITIARSTEVPPGGNH
jgi:1,2-diacylglycerol 3-beta-glucosyltransferase